MRTKRLVAVVSGGLLTAAVVAGCGDSSDEAGDGGSGDGGDYCGMIEDVQSEFSSLQGGDPTLGDLSALSERFGDIASAAPSEVSGDWKKMDTTLGDMVTALDDAGVEKDAPLQDAVKDAVAEDQSKAADLTEAAQAMTTLDTEKIQQNVKDECDMELGESSK